MKSHLSSVTHTNFVEPLRAPVFVRARAGVRTLVCACALVCALVVCAPAAQQSVARRVSVRGVVRDAAGAVVARVAVSLRAAENARVIVVRTETGADGRFAFDEVSLPAGTTRLVVIADGEGLVGSVERELAADEAGALELDIAVSPAPSPRERVEVSATRTEERVDESASSVAVLSERDVQTTAAVRLDDALRQTVGFSLFRRTGSRAANPTTQGVSLRGTGASGASRALVLVDGVPLNDPFGGWVYWDRVPREEVARVEVLRGGASALYGSGALGGVVNIFRRRADANAVSLETSYGSERTPEAGLFASATRGAWAASVGAEMFRTDGYVLVGEQERGRVDTPANARDAAIDLTLERKFATDARAFLRGSFFGEARANGTPLQTNRTHVRQFSAGGDFASLSLGSLSLGSLVARVFGGTQVFDQNFSAVSADRNSETLTRVQRSPSQSVGASLQWSRAFGKSQTLVAGADAREVRGSSDEIAYAAGRATSLIGAGGRERDAGAFVEDVARVGSRLIVTGGARFDRWREYDAASTTQPLRAGALASVVPFAERAESAVSPRASVLFKLTSRVSLDASVYRAFRQPTLNELYRSFRVGNVQTQANENLRAERLTGGEAGANFTTLDQKFNLRATFFWSDITRPVANVTLSVTPALITRERENLGRTRACGVEIESEARLGRRWFARGGYLFVSPTVVEFPANRALEGLQVPQVARQQLTFQVRYDDARAWTASVQGRASGAQFDDDQNLFRLAPYFTLDAYAARRVRRSLSLFVAAENLLNRRYEVGRTPVLTLGPPLLARVGLRVQLGSR